MPVDDEITFVTEGQPIRCEIREGQSVTIDKLFGPSAFDELRITPDLNRGWVIEYRNANGEWSPAVILPANFDDKEAPCSAQ